jgi:hypothetical protein
MRKIEYVCTIESSSSDHLGTDVRSETHQGYFHQFTGGYMSEVEAIVEDESGRIHLVTFNRVKFLDKPPIL